MLHVLPTFAVQVFVVAARNTKLWIFQLWGTSYSLVMKSLKNSNLHGRARTDLHHGHHPAEIRGGSKLNSRPCACNEIILECWWLRLLRMLGESTRLLYCCSLEFQHSGTWVNLHRLIDSLLFRMQILGSPF